MKQIKGHVHAESMALYAEDAKTHAEPWKLWQIKTGSFDWIDCKFGPSWDSSCDFRRKPKTHTVNGVEVPDLRIKPKDGEPYYSPNPTYKQQTMEAFYGNNDHHNHRSQNLLCYEHSEDGKQAAILHAKAWLGIA